MKAAIKSGMEFFSHSEEETIGLAGTVAKTLRSGDVLLLEGDLGAGKSVFARALIRALSGEPELEVPSPTFTLVQTYDTRAGAVWHFDLYRIKDSNEIWELGWEDALDGGIVLVEWPSRLEDTMISFRYLALRFTTAPGREARIITMTPHGVWEKDFLPES